MMLADQNSQILRAAPPPCAARSPLCVSDTMRGDLVASPAVGGSGQPHDMYYNNDSENSPSRQGGVGVKQVAQSNKNNGHSNDTIPQIMNHKSGKYVKTNQSIAVVTSPPQSSGATITCEADKMFIKRTSDLGEEEEEDDRESWDEDVDMEEQRRSCKHRSDVTVQNSPARPQAVNSSAAVVASSSAKSSKSNSSSSSATDYPFDVTSQDRTLGSGLSLFDNPPLCAPDFFHPSVKVVTIRDYEFDTSCATVYAGDIVDFVLSPEVPLHAEHVLEGMSTNRQLAFVSGVLSNDTSLGESIFRYVPQCAGEVRISCQVFPDTMDCHLSVADKTSRTQRWLGSGLVSRFSQALPSEQPAGAPRAAAPTEAEDAPGAAGSSPPPVLSGSLLRRSPSQSDPRSRAEVEATTVVLTSSYKMVPAELRLPMGSAVTFKCEESNLSSHHLVCTDLNGDDAFGGGAVSVVGRASYTHVFPRSGRFTVSHEIFPFMKCKLTVTSEASSAPRAERLSAAEARTLFVDMHNAKDEAARRRSPNPSPPTALSQPPAEVSAPDAAPAAPLVAGSGDGSTSSVDEIPVCKPGSAKAEKKKKLKKARKVAKREAAVLQEFLEDAALYLEVAQAAWLEEKEAAMEAEEEAVASTATPKKSKKQKQKQQQEALMIEQEEALPIEQPASVTAPAPEPAQEKEEEDEEEEEAVASTATPKKSKKQKQQQLRVKMEPLERCASEPDALLIAAEAATFRLGLGSAQQGAPQVDEALLVFIESAERLLLTRWQSMLEQLQLQAARDAAGGAPVSRGRIVFYRCPDSEAAAEAEAAPTKKKYFKKNYNKNKPA